MLLQNVTTFQALCSVKFFPAASHLQGKSRMKVGTGKFLLNLSANLFGGCGGQVLHWREEAIRSPQCFSAKLAMIAVTVLAI